MSDADLHPRMQISLEGPDGGTIPLQVESSETIDSVKARIMDEVGIPVHQIKLVYDGNPLEDGSTLADFNIQQGSTLHLELILRGGGQEDGNIGPRQSNEESEKKNKKKKQEGKAEPGSSETKKPEKNKKKKKSKEQRG